MAIPAVMPKGAFPLFPPLGDGPFDGWDGVHWH